MRRTGSIDERVAGVELDRRRLGDLGIQRAEPHVEAGLPQDRREPRDVLQVETVARVVLGDQQQTARVGADLVDRGHRRLHRERHDLGCEVVEAARIEIGVDRRDLEARVAEVDRAVERRRVLLPLEPEPALDRRRRVEHAPLEVGERTGQRRDEMWNHGGSRVRAGRSEDAASIRSRIVMGIRARDRMTRPQARRHRSGMSNGRSRGSRRAGRRAGPRGRGPYGW